MLLERRIPLGYVLGKIKYDILYIAIIGLVVYGIKRKYIDMLPDIPIAIPAFIGTAISVILSFKLNQSYDRWWEARKIWGGIVNESRNLLLQLHAFLPVTERLHLRMIGHRQIAWCHALGRALRGQEPLAGAERLLTPEDLAELRRNSHVPLGILRMNAEHMARLRDEEHLDSYTHVQANSTLTRLCDLMGMAERIKNTVFPVTYRLFLHLFIYLFIVTLSISMKNIALYYELPLLMVISASFLLLEKSAKHLQDPFSNLPTDTPMTAISTTIEMNIRQLLEERDLPKRPEPAEFYLM